MSIKLRTIEVDAHTADLLEARAVARGLSVRELLADLACNDEALPADLAAMRTNGEGPWSPGSRKTLAALRNSNTRGWASRGTRSRPGWRVGACRTSCRRLSRASCEADRNRFGSSRHRTAACIPQEQESGCGATRRLCSRRRNAKPENRARARSPIRRQGRARIDRAVWWIGLCLALRLFGREDEIIVFRIWHGREQRD